MVSDIQLEMQLILIMLTCMTPDSPQLHSGSSTMVVSVSIYLLIDFTRLVPSALLVMDYF